MISLNKEQYLASRPDRGVSLVIAGAGTGKTRILVEKVKNIISEGITDPKSILILTFSAKAAQEIKERVEYGVGKGAESITSGTFHSFCLGFLRDNSSVFLDRYGFERFPEVIDKEEKDKLRRDLLRGLIDRFLGLPVNVVSGLLESTGRLEKRIFRKLERIGIIKEADEFNKQFNVYKISNNLIDFGDMMNYTIDLLANDNSIREQTIAKYRYILVDEFQDTSEDNFRLLKLILPDSKRSLFMVGDDWQSIYAFRGSSIDYIVKVKKYFNEAAIYKLIHNYRSRKEIVKLSNNFIRKNRYRTGKKLKAVKGKGGTVKNYCTASLEEEAEMIAGIIKKQSENTKYNSNDIAVLYRNNWQGSYISRKLDPIIKEYPVKLMTMHASKGLEFDTVIIAGISDDVIPDASCDIEEERRLFYVALTRARDNLYILHRKSADGNLSAFAEELGFPVN